MWGPSASARGVGGGIRLEYTELLVRGRICVGKGVLCNGNKEENAKIYSRG